ncbi:hypothetical protein C8Q76DRAFT_724015 [Earliella scabrosa]|nr:hypothetical protein C8Q76DRAFT_724015 [Earliella scabrosa]
MTPIQGTIANYNPHPRAQRMPERPQTSASPHSTPRAHDLRLSACSSTRPRNEPQPHQNNFQRTPAASQVPTPHRS